MQLLGLTLILYVLKLSVGNGFQKQLKSIKLEDLENLFNFVHKCKIQISHIKTRLSVCT